MIRSEIGTQLSDIHWKACVTCATTESINITSGLKAGSIIDEYELKIGDRVLVKDQNFKSENGVYSVGEQTKRALDFDSGDKYINAATLVLNGRKNRGTYWVCTTDKISEWSTPIVFDFLFSVGTIIGGGLSFNGSVMSIDKEKTLTADDEQTVSNKKLDSKSVTFSSGEDSFKFDLEGRNAFPVEYTYKLPLKSTSLYGENAQIIPPEDGGTGVGRIEENEILIGNKNLSYSKMKITDDAKELLQQENLIEFLSEYLDISDLAAYSYEELLELYSKIFIKSDGSIPFTSTIAGIRPIEPEDLATKDYVDSVLQGVRYLGAVESATYLNPETIIDLEKDKFYIVHENAVGAWEGKDGYIALFSQDEDDEAGWRFIAPSVEDTVYIIDEGYLAQWNGKSWINIGKPSVNSHDALVDVKGGKWHLSEKQYKELFVSPNPVKTHKHRHNELVDIQGGTANQKWHLGRQEYYELTGQTECATIHKHDHNLGLVNAQGGREGEKFHLTEMEHKELTTGRETKVHSHSHTDLSNIKGNGDYHLSLEELNQLINGESTELHTHRHNDLVDLQGGIENERFHLSREQYLSLVSGIITNLHSHEHDEMTGILGGKDREHYHLDAATYVKIVNDKYGIREHNKLGSIQGGSSGEYYHVSKEIYQQLKDFHGIIGRHNTFIDLQGGQNDQYYHLNKEERDFVFDLLNKGIQHQDLSGVQGSGDYHLSFDEHEELTSGKATNLHTHSEFIKRDGSVEFENPVVGVNPILHSHLATKEYVDNLSFGYKWMHPVNGTALRNPSSITPIKGIRYAIPENATGEWSNLFGNIAEYDGSSWNYELADKNAAFFDLSTECSYCWNGNAWIQISAKNVQHNGLGGLEGGTWHLERDQYYSLTSGENSESHYHESDRNLENATGTLAVNKGGTGLDRIDANMILYSPQPNVIGTLPISSLGQELITIRKYSEILNLLSIGTLASQNSDAVEITGGKITGIKPLEVAYGGTGVSKLSGILKGNGSGAMCTAIPDVDYLTPEGKSVLMNKEIDARANGNSVFNLSVENFGPGIISTDPTFSDASDRRLSTASAIKAFIEEKIKSLQSEETEEETEFIPETILLINSNKKPEYKKLKSSDLLDIKITEEEIIFNLSKNIVTEDKEQTLSNKTLDRPIIDSRDWLYAKHSHTSDDTGGRITEEALVSPISIKKGGTGLHTIGKNNMIYAIADDVFGTIELGKFMIHALSSKTEADFLRNLGNSLELKQLRLKSPDDENYVPDVRSDSSMKIFAKDDLTIGASELSLSTSLGDVSISKDGSIKISSLEKIGMKSKLIELDVSSKNPTAESIGVYVKDKMANEKDKPSSSLTIAGTLAILPYKVFFSDAEKEIELDAKQVGYSSIILVMADEEIDDSNNSIRLILPEPSDFIGQIIKIKTLTNKKINIFSRYNTIDGYEYASLDEKYQIISLYAIKEEWLII